MKKLFLLAILLFSISIFASSCSTSEKKINNDVEDNISTAASTDNFADLGNKVWIDANKDGIKQRPESGFSGIVINLYKDTNKDGKPDGKIFKTDTTDKGGYYRFNAIDPDINYVLEVIAPDGYEFSANNSESNSVKNDFDSDIIPATGFSKTIDVKKGRYFYWYDAALHAIGPITNGNPARVGDKIWLDSNKDGIKQRPESGLADITLNLWLDTTNNNKPDKKIATTKTNRQGNYEFSNLNPALSYFVEIELESGYSISNKHNPKASGKDWDSDFNSNRFTDKLDLVPDKFNYWSADAGIYKGTTPASKIEIASYAWIDYNNDGIRQTAEEYGSLGTVLNLWQDTNNDGKADKKIATTKTSFRGYYHFTNLDSSKSYFVEVELPSGYKLAQKHNPAAPNGKVDSDFNQNGFTDKLVLPNTDFFAGLAGAALIPPATPTDQAAKIGDMVWGDANKNGIHDDWERGMHEELTVNLYRDINADGIPDYEVYKTTKTYRGYYQFSGLSPNHNWIVEVIPPTGYGFGPLHNPEAPSIYRDSDIIPETGLTASIDIEAGKNHYGIDASVILLTNSNSCQDPVTIPDPVLKEALQDALGNSNISCSGLAGLSLLDYSGQFASTADIKDLSGLRFAKNLETLRLDHNSISDISEIASLSKLTNLQLDFNNISDVSALATLTNLKYLNFSNNKVTNVDALANLKELIDLEIQFNKITNIDSIAELSKLWHVRVYSNKIQNISKRLNLPKVTQFTFGNNEIVDISGLSGLVNLTRLGLHNNKVVDISPLSSLPKLAELYLSDNPGLKDLSALKNVPGLTLLYLNNVKPMDISFLAKTNLLETIAMQNSGLSDISVFEQLTELHLVMIQKNKITDISPIVRIEGIDGGIVRISENCLDISGGQDLADINNLKDRNVTVNYTPQSNCN